MLSATFIPGRGCGTAAKTTLDKDKLAQSSARVDRAQHLAAQIQTGWQTARARKPYLERRRPRIVEQVLVQLPPCDERPVDLPSAETRRLL